MPLSNSQSLLSQLRVSYSQFYAECMLLLLLQVSFIVMTLENSSPCQVFKASENCLKTCISESQFLLLATAAFKYSSNLKMLNDFSNIKNQVFSFV